MTTRPHKPKSWITFVSLIAIFPLNLASAQPGMAPVTHHKHVSPPSPSPDDIWAKVNAGLLNTLDTSDLGDLAVSLAAAKPTTDPSELMLRLSVFVRAGDSKQAEAAIRSLKTTPIAHQRIYGIPGFLMDNHEYALAKLMLEKFPLAEATCPAGFISYIVSTAPPVDPDKWFVARCRSNRNFWFWQRLAYRKRIGTLPGLFDELAKDLRRHPTDLNRANLYTNVMDLENRSADISWLPDVCKFPLAVQYMVIAERIRSSYPNIALRFLERSYDMAITPQDLTWLRTTGNGMLGSAAFPNEESIRDLQRYYLMYLYKQVGQDAKALKVMEEITASYPNGLPSGFGELAGQSQAATGTRVFETRITAAEGENKDSQAYWITRAEYYSGRKENDKAEDAFLKSLDIGAKAGYDSEPRCSGARSYAWFLFTTRSYADAVNWVQAQLQASPGPGEYGKSLSAELITLQHEYIRSLWIGKGAPVAAKWIRDRLEKLPPTGAATERLVGEWMEFAMNGLDQVSLNDELLWRYLEAKPEWGHTEREALNQLTRSSNKAETEAGLARIEKLASNGEPSRGLLVASYLAYVGNGDRAVPWLLQAMKNYPPGDKSRREAASSLYAHYLKRNNWREAAALLVELQPAAQDRDWNIRNAFDLALAAARSGDGDDALRLFKQITNYNRSLYSRAGGLARVLASLGLKEQLVTFYNQMAAQDPNSHSPQEALALLDQPINSRRGPGGPATAR